MSEIKCYKIRLLPTKSQEQQFFKNCGAVRFIYNWALELCDETYKESKKHLSAYDVSNIYTKHQVRIDNPWLNEIPRATLQRAFQDLQVAFKRFFNGISNYPKFKSRHKSKLSFYTRYDRLKFISNTQLKMGFNTSRKRETIKFISDREIPQGKFINPRITFNGKYWLLSFGIENQDTEKPSVTNEVIGVDVGIKELAVCSDGYVHPNINKSRTIKLLKKRLKRFQRKFARCQKDSNNRKKLKCQIKLIYKRIADINKNHKHQLSSRLVKKLPRAIVVEDLSIRNMLKNRHLSRVIHECGWGELYEQLEYKCKESGIEFIKINRFYPSSKTCSSCGHIHKTLTLKDRVFTCPSCGFVMDRDLNAARNIAAHIGNGGTEFKSVDC